MDSKGKIFPNEHRLQLDKYFKIEMNRRLKFSGQKFEYHSEGYKVLYHTLISYFSRSEKFFDSPIVKNAKGKSLDKGLLILGGHGIGKTFFFDTMTEFNSQLIPYKNNFARHSSNEVVELYDLNGAKGITEFVNKGQRYFDDLGSEEAGSHFKTSNVFRVLIERRYDIFKRQGLKTFITSNLSRKEILDRYGSRVESRIFEMFNIIVTEGEDRRKQ